MLIHPRPLVALFITLCFGLAAFAADVDHSAFDAILRPPSRTSGPTTRPSRTSTSPP